MNLGNRCRTVLTTIAQRLAAVLVVACCAACSSQGNAQEVSEGNPSNSSGGDANGDELYDVTALPADERLRVCDNLEPLVVSVLEGTVERMTDQSGCEYVRVEPRPPSAITLFAVTGDRGVLDAVADDFHDLNGRLTVLSSRSVLSTEPFIAVPGEGTTSRIDCGRSVIYDLVLPRTDSAASITLEAERILCAG